MRGQGRFVLLAIAMVRSAARGPGGGGRTRRRDAGRRDARRLGDLRRGRPLGGQHERRVLRASTRSARRRTGTRATRRVDPRLPSLEGRAGVHRRRRARLQPRLLGRARPRRPAPATDEDFKPGIDFYSDAQGRVGPGARAAVARRDAQRQGRRRDDRRQQLRLRRHRHPLRDELGDVADVVEELLLRRQRHDVALHVDADRDRDDERAQRAAARARRDDERRLQRVAVHDPRADVLVAGAARRADPLLRERLDAPVRRRLRRLEPRRRLGQRHRSSPR